MNSGVPLTLTNHSELAAQFGRFTKQIIDSKQAAEVEEPNREKRRAFLGLI